MTTDEQCSATVSGQHMWTRPVAAVSMAKTIDVGFEAASLASDQWYIRCTACGVQKVRTFSVSS